ncbi:amino acid ABC transporter permease [Paraliobacillus ryukyuensis]|uniref:amino acid ABC transporter permease n=1 Tax=Paraliobacillus ryukyuensis TaxID=200904 RepID=UPI00277B4A29|nr:ABC transporter permease subunit [Paraliobacillus ryukyuensis]
MNILAKKSHISTPFWRDNRMIPIMLQLFFAIFVLLICGYLINNALIGLERLGIDFGFDFLQRTSSFNISESLITFQPTDTYGRALLVGILNTLKVSIIGVILTTIVGVIVGIARLSNNWLVRKLSGLYIEIIRNTPLLVQLFIWYFAVLLTLPSAQESVSVAGFYFNNSGIAMPWFTTNDATAVWVSLFIIGVVGAIIIWVIQLKRQIKNGKRTFPFLWSLATLIIMLVIAFIVSGSAPVNIDNPVLGNFNFTGGLRISSEFTAILLGLVIYTATYIAEIVRGGIQSVSKGQTEAAKALGIKNSTMMRLIILPQAIRIIIPPVTSQYLNLTKNSSLAIAVGYQELVSVGNTSMNQSGHAIEIIIIMISVYLIVSLITSLAMNSFNRRMQLVER